jgi:hypothetical protein
VKLVFRIWSCLELCQTRPYITIGCRKYKCLDWIHGMAPELHHGFTMQGQPWQLGHGLSHLLSNSRTCGGHQLPPGASPSCRRPSNEWMNGSPSLGAQGVLFMPLGILGACSNLSCTRSSLGEKRTWFP